MCVSGDVDNIIVDVFVNGADNEVSDEILSTVVGELTLVGDRTFITVLNQKVYDIFIKQ